MDDTIGKVQNKAATIGLIVGGVLIVAVAVVALVMGQFNKKKVISSTSPAAPATLQNFDGGEKLGYIVGHPLDWEVQQPNDSAVIMGKYSGDDYTTLAIQNINTTDNGGSFATLDELVQEYQSQIRAADPKATFSDVNDFPSLKNQYGVDLQAKIYD
ncbi:MAG: hypothetical protein HW383_300, partial [Candidatus Magasanikbacteria bacterium]|nr:hypothetical protein [Candidatus Magasanikbacteria bacterium]